MVRRGVRGEGRKEGKGEVGKKKRGGGKEGV